MSDIQENLQEQQDKQQQQAQAIAATQSRDSEQQVEQQEKSQINDENHDSNGKQENQEIQPAQQNEQNDQQDEQETMKYGDMIILYISHDKIKQVQLQEKGCEGTVYGQFPHSHFVGKQYGQKIYCYGKGGFVYALKPSSSLITTSLPHKTQIIYHSDISTIIFKLNILPGSKVIESGTGSGSLSCGILSTIQEHGHLYTFEFNAERVQNGIKLFQNFGYKNVDVIHRDAIGEGFLNKEGENYDVLNSDAVFLDLPSPWKAIHHAKAVLKQGGRLACYSPCIEQCQKNNEEILQLGFIDVHTIEVVQRVHERQFQEFKSVFDVNEINVKRKREEAQSNQSSLLFQNKQFVQSYGHSFGHTAYLTFARLP